MAKLYDLHENEIVQNAKDLENRSADTSFRHVVFAECDDDWDDAELGVVWKLLGD